MEKKTMDDVVELNRKKGMHWFSPDTMRFFNTRYGKLYANKYFISSEKSPHNTRKWTVRKVDWNTGDIKNVSYFGQFDSELKAKYYLKNAKKLKDVI